MDRPCNGACNINKDRICVGCNMTVVEIQNWFCLDEDAQRKLKADIQTR